MHVLVLIFIHKYTRIHTLTAIGNLLVHSSATLHAQGLTSSSSTHVYFYAQDKRTLCIGVCYCRCCGSCCWRWCFVVVVVVAVKLVLCICSALMKSIFICSSAIRTVFHIRWHFRKNNKKKKKKRKHCFWNIPRKTNVIRSLYFYRIPI